MKKINEIFYSIQGEGFNAGMPAIFIRFSGCNVCCSFCDTEHQGHVKMDDEDILFSLNHYAPCKTVILTGGEPAMQVDAAFISRLHDEGYKVAIETNGTIKLPEGIDWITVSPKHSPVKLKQTSGNELKLVYQNQPFSVLNNYSSMKFDHLYLQPCSNKNIEETVDMVKRMAGTWHLSIQIQKLIKIQ